MVWGGEDKCEGKFDAMVCVLGPVGGVTWVGISECDDMISTLFYSVVQSISNRITIIIGRTINNVTKLLTFS